MCTPSSLTLPTLFSFLSTNLTSLALLSSGDYGQSIDHDKGIEPLVEPHLELVFDVGKVDLALVEFVVAVHGQVRVCGRHDCGSECVRSCGGGVRAVITFKVILVSRTDTVVVVGSLRTAIPAHSLCISQRRDSHALPLLITLYTQHAKKYDSKVAESTLTLRRTSQSPFTANMVQCIKGHTYTHSQQHCASIQPGLDCTHLLVASMATSSTR